MPQRAKRVRSTRACARSQSRTVSILPVPPPTSAPPSLIGRAAATHSFLRPEGAAIDALVTAAARPSSSLNPGQAQVNARPGEMRSPQQWLTTCDYVTSELDSLGKPVRSLPKFKGSWNACSLHELGSQVHSLLSSSFRHLLQLFLNSSRLAHVIACRLKVEWIEHVCACAADKFMCIRERSRVSRCARTATGTILLPQILWLTLPAAAAADSIEFNVNELAPA